MVSQILFYFLDILSKGDSFFLPWETLFLVLKPFHTVKNLVTLKLFGHQQDDWEVTQYFKNNYNSFINYEFYKK